MHGSTKSSQTNQASSSDKAATDLRANVGPTPHDAPVPQVIPRFKQGDDISFLNRDYYITQTTRFSGEIHYGVSMYGEERHYFWLPQFIVDLTATLINKSH